MFLKRTSPNLLLPCDGCLEFGDTDVHGSTISHERHKRQIDWHGTCDGEYIPPAHHKRRIPFLEKAGQLITDALNNPFDYDIGHIFWHKDKINKCGGYRKVRSEQRRSLTLKVGRFIIHHVNLATQSLGHFVREKNDFHYYDYAYIAKMTKMNLCQLKRTMARFIREGYISIEQRRKRLIDGTYRSLSPIIRINPSLFIDLGFDEKQVMFHIELGQKKLDKEKTKASRNKEKKNLCFQPVRKQSDTAMKAISEIIQTLSKKLNNNTS